MKLPTPIKHALIEATIFMYTEIYPSSRSSKEPLAFAIP